MAGLVVAYLLEISNGLAIIKNSDLAADVFILMTVLLDAFGGVCIIMQTRCVCNNYISIKKYIYQKLVLCIVTLNSYATDICIISLKLIIIILHLNHYHSPRYLRNYLHY